jgi:O-antigen ligase
MLFFVDLVLSVALSEKPQRAYSELIKYRHILLGGLIFIAPLSNENRKKLITVFFLSAALDALTGILQYFGLVFKGNERPDGFSSHTIIFAADLAFVCGSAVLMLFIKNSFVTTIKDKYLLVFVALLTLIGILLSQSRGVWVAIFVACTIVLFMHSRRKAIVFLIYLIVITGTVFSFSDTLRHRVVSIVTSIYTENEQGSTGARLEIWKGSLLLFKEKPICGVGYGDFRENLKRLVDEKKLKDVSGLAHAHNIYFQVLATRGIIGFVILVALFASLIMWGKKEIRDHGGIGGYIIILCALLTIVGGLTENNIEIPRFLAICGLTIGLIGPYGAKKNIKPRVGTDRVIIDKK